MRPLFLRNAERTRGYALVVMLAYRIVQELADCWAPFDFTIEAAVQQLSTLCAISVSVNGTPTYHQIPTPPQETQQMIDAAGITLPSHFRNSGVTVSTTVKPEKDDVTR